MLVLSRKNEESVVVGGPDGVEQLVKVTVLEIRHAIVRLGFEASTDVSVHREEVWRRIRAGRRRDPPNVGRNGTGSRSGDRTGNVLSGVEEGRSPKSMRDRV